MAHPDNHPAKFPSDRRQRAIEMHRAGLFGGRQPGAGRPRKDRSAGEQIGEMAARETGAIRRAFSDGLRSRNERTRILAARELLSEERRARQRQDHEAILRQLPDAELEALLIDVISDATGLDLSALKSAREVVVEADVIEDAGEIELVGEQDEQPRKPDRRPAA